MEIELTIRYRIYLANGEHLIIPKYNYYGRQISKFPADYNSFEDATEEIRKNGEIYEEYIVLPVVSKRTVI